MQAQNGQPVIYLALHWWVEVLTGRLGTSIGVLAVAWLGLALMQGRIPLREALRVLLGCFLLFGAPMIAAGLLDTLTQRRPQPPEISPPDAPPAPLPSQAPPMPTIQPGPQRIRTTTG